MSARKPAGRVEIHSHTGWRVRSYVMGGSIKLADDEWLNMLGAERPVMIMSAGLPIWIMNQPGWADFVPGEIMARRLDFRRTR